MGLTQQHSCVGQNCQSLQWIKRNNEYGKQKEKKAQKRNPNWKKRGVADAGGQSGVVGDYLSICDYKVLVICVARSVS